MRVQVYEDQWTYALTPEDIRRDAGGPRYRGLSIREEVISDEDELIARYGTRDVTGKRFLRWPDGTGFSFTRIERLFD